MNIRTKLALAFLITVLLPTVVLSYVVALKALQQSRSEFAYHARQKMALVDATYTAFLDSVKDDVAYLARMKQFHTMGSDLANYLGAEAVYPATERGRREQDEVEDVYEDYAIGREHLESVYAGTVEGAFIQRLVGVSLTDYDPRLRPWYEAAVRDPRTVIVTEPYWAVTNEPMISVATTIHRPDGSLFGVQSVDVTLELLTSLIASAKLGDSGYIILINDDGTVIADPNNIDNAFRNFREIDQPLFQGLASRTLEYFSRPGKIGHSMVASYTSPQTGWHFLTVIDQDEIFAPAYQMIRWSVIVALLMVVVFVAVGTIIARRITDPINHVSSSLSRIVEGGADLNKTLDVRSRDEIGKLAGHFNSFLASVKLKQQDAIRDQKLEAVGQLSAGIAHEINTPAQFVGDNITFLGQSFDDLWSLLTEYERQMANIEAGGDVAGSMVIIRDAVEKIDMEFLGKELPDAIRESAKGIERINTIVHAMKEFTHPGSDDPQCVDLNRAVQSTVTMARSEWRYCAELDMRLDPDLPHVDCYAGDINQAILNIVVNAAHAIEDKRIQIGAAELGTISIETMHDDDTVTIRIADSGKGVEKADIHRIFNPFFTTREVGKGTGQGLAIAFRAIVDRHKGKLEVDSVAGQGATFTIVLPRHKPVPEDSSIDIAVPALALT